MPTTLNAKHTGTFETRAECEAAGREFERLHANDQLKVVRWSYQWR